MSKYPVDNRAFVVIVLMVIVVGVFVPVKSSAVNPNEVLADPALELRARNLSTKLRCLVCQNQSIDDSDAALAKDLRMLLRKRLVAGDSDDQVVDYIVSRYGEFVLLKPRFGLHTAILWSLPVFLILLGFLIAFLKFKSRRRVDTQMLTPDENDRITKLLNESD
jgi:cytochrome c-type biogenesis protein CcmH